MNPNAIRLHSILEQPGVVVDFPLADALVVLAPLLGLVMGELVALFLAESFLQADWQM